ncbi:CHAT domain-containing protein [Propionivibrio dicarboxylicus]|uniref:CHAT domain-containing protein n=1 Tax=Propionivibrio dicarboxylicus TaxID=83767 RepID=A0A1G8N7K0_9RHOO|nr:CHAT domain-containing protein [Propionivibrio dicarboxylicus]SDI76007.1 CHAT domain-containing protein [Propionivibrio dicarboxylicus]
MPANTRRLLRPARFALGPIAVLCLALSLAGCAARNDVQMAEGITWRQGTLQGATEIRQLIGPAAPNQRIRNDQTARAAYDAGLAAWRSSPRWTSTADLNAFQNGLGKLVDAYISYLLGTSQPAVAAQVLQTAATEADAKREYQPAIAYRIQLAETLRAIGQLERAQATLTEAQSIQDKIHGPLPAKVSAQDDPTQICNQGAIWAAQIRAGKSFTRAQLANFSAYYEEASTTAPRIRYCDPSMSVMNFQTVRAYANDDDLYRKDQDVWRSIASGALAAGDPALARSAATRMMASANAAASRNPQMRGVKPSEALDSYLRNFHNTPYELRVLKASDSVFGIEVEVDYAIIGAELALRYDDLGQAETLLAKAQQALGQLRMYSDELGQRGLLGLKPEERTREWQRVMAKLHLRHKRWADALALLEPYLAWSENFRNSLSLEERLPYFRGTAQGAYQDAMLARAALYAQQPDNAAFDAALHALGQLKARHLKDALDASGKSGEKHNEAPTVSATTTVDTLVARGSSYLAVADTGDTLITYLADAKGKSIRLARKPAGFDANVLSLRNGLAERQLFDARAARNIATLALGDFESRVFGTRRLIAEVDGALSFLPVELWLDAKMQALGAQTALSYLPTLAMADTARPSSTGKGVLALGDARFDAARQIDAIDAQRELKNRGTRDNLGFAPLPETRDEVNAILRNVREGGTAILGVDATKSGFRREAEKTPYRYLHFATHGVVGGEIPRINEPALVLTPEAGDPGFLTASEIARMNVRADLVVLSACNTGNGEYFNGEGLMGLGRAFILAGARAVVVSLWPVDSLTTRDLMIDFYRELEKSGDARQALALARQNIMRDKTGTAGDARNLQRITTPVAQSGEFKGRKNPFFWAPFILIEAGAGSASQS